MKNNRIMKNNNNGAEVIFYSNLDVPMLHEDIRKNTSDIKKAVCMNLENFEEYMKAEDRVDYLRQNGYI